jgi:hypothetical protein
MKKKRGAQPGNNNALHHGLYSTAYQSRASRTLDEFPASDLTAEIELIRVMTARFVESVHSGAQLDPETQLSALRAVTLSVQAISSLLRLQALRSSASKFGDITEEQAMRELDPDYDKKP